MTLQQHYDAGQMKIQPIYRFPGLLIKVTFMGLTSLRIEWYDKKESGWLAISKIDFTRIILN